jgi:hypothetical protein
MMPSPPIRHRTDTRHSGRLSAASAAARVGPPDWPAIAPQIFSRNQRPARSRSNPHPFIEAKPPRRPLQSNLPATHPAAKSP